MKRLRLLLVAFKMLCDGSLWRSVVSAIDHRIVYGKFDELWNEEPELDPRDEYARLERKRKIARCEKREIV